MVKKEVIKAIADNNTKVSTLCEYLGTLRTEYTRTYQSAEAQGTHNFGEMYDLYVQIAELNNKLSSLVSNYVLNDETTANKNFECAHTLVVDIDKKNNHKGAFVAYFDLRISSPKGLQMEGLFFYSTSELSGYITKVYNDYLLTLDDVRKARTKREKLADRKARLLAQLEALEAEENAAEETK